MADDSDKLRERAAALSSRVQGFIGREDLTQEQIALKIQTEALSTLGPELTPFEALDPPVLESLVAFGASAAETDPVLQAARLLHASAAVGNGRRRLDSLREVSDVEAAVSLREAVLLGIAGECRERIAALSDDIRRGAEALVTSGEMPYPEGSEPVRVVLTELYRKHGVDPRPSEAMRDRPAQLDQLFAKVEEVRDAMVRSKRVLIDLARRAQSGPELTVALDEWEASL